MFDGDNATLRTYEQILELQGVDYEAPFCGRANLEDQLSLRQRQRAQLIVDGSRECGAGFNCDEMFTSRGWQCLIYNARGDHGFTGPLENSMKLGLTTGRLVQGLRLASKDSGRTEESVLMSRRRCWVREW